jgi:predicted nucleic acid-binding protein
VDRKRLVIDACCMLNLLATGRELDIAEALRLLLLETPQVSREPLYLSTAPDDDLARRREPASTTALRAAGFLETRALDTEALVDALVACAARIKDTDASCIALAGVLEIPLVTDDRKERNIAKDIFPRIELASTLDLLHEAATALQWNDGVLVEVASNLRWRGNFAPPKRDPRGRWYLALLERGGIAAP